VSPVKIEDGSPQGLYVPCGKCIACRIARTREWTVRIMHEMSCHDNAVFATLTYDDDHLPPDRSISKDELQRFIKRLRKELGDRKIRYFACGEYGETTNRPHYHAIIFGLGLTEDTLSIVINTNNLKTVTPFRLSPIEDLIFQNALQD
jgi:hypothetical protein